jgi:hypothetical protein
MKGKPTERELKQADGKNKPAANSPRVSVGQNGEPQPSPDKIRQQQRESGES